LAARTSSLKEEVQPVTTGLTNSTPFDGTPVTLTSSEEVLELENPSSTLSSVKNFVDEEIERSQHGVAYPFISGENHSESSALDKASAEVEDELKRMNENDELEYEKAKYTYMLDAFNETLVINDEKNRRSQENYLMKLGSYDVEGSNSDEEYEDSYLSLDYPAVKNDAQMLYFYDHERMELLDFYENNVALVDVDVELTYVNPVRFTVNEYLQFVNACRAANFEGVFHQYVDRRFTEQTRYVDFNIQVRVPPGAPDVSTLALVPVRLDVITNTKRRCNGGLLKYTFHFCQDQRYMKIYQMREHFIIFRNLVLNSLDYILLELSAFLEDGLDIMEEMRAICRNIGFYFEHGFLRCEIEGSIRYEHLQVVCEGSEFNEDILSNNIDDKVVRSKDRRKKMDFDRNEITQRDINYIVGLCEFRLRKQKQHLLLLFERTNDWTLIDVFSVLPTSITLVERKGIAKVIKRFSVDKESQNKLIILIKLIDLPVEREGPKINEVIENLFSEDAIRFFKNSMTWKVLLEMISFCVCTTHGQRALSVLRLATLMPGRQWRYLIDGLIGINDDEDFEYNESKAFSPKDTWKFGDKRTKLNGILEEFEIFFKRGCVDVIPEGVSFLDLEQSYVIPEGDAVHLLESGYMVLKMKLVKLWTLFIGTTLFKNVPEGVRIMLGTIQMHISDFGTMGEFVAEFVKFVSDVSRNIAVAWKARDPWLLLQSSEMNLYLAEYEIFRKMMADSKIDGPPEDYDIMLERVIELIDKGKLIASKSKIDIRDTISSLLHFRDVIEGYRSKKRDKPFGLILSGASGAGKTKAIETIESIVLAHMGIIQKDGCHMNATLDYEVGAKYQQYDNNVFVLHYNDALGVKEEYIQGEDMVGMLQRAVDTSDLVMPRADLKEKADAKIFPRVVALSTNAETYTLVKSQKAEKLNRRLKIAHVEFTENCKALAANEKVEPWKYFETNYNKDDLVFIQYGDMQSSGSVINCLPKVTHTFSSWKKFFVFFAIEYKNFRDVIERENATVVERCSAGAPLHGIELRCACNLNTYKSQSEITKQIVSRSVLVVDPVVREGVVMDYVTTGFLYLRQQRRGIGQLSTSQKEYYVRMAIDLYNKTVLLNKIVLLLFMLGVHQWLGINGVVTLLLLLEICYYPVKTYYMKHVHVERVSIAPLLVDCSYFVGLSWCNPFLGLGWLIYSLNTCPTWRYTSYFVFKNYFSRSRNVFAKYLFQKFGWKFLFNDELFTFEIVTLFTILGMLASFTLIRQLIKTLAGVDVQSVSKPEQPIPLVVLPSKDYRELVYDNVDKDVKIRDLEKEKVRLSELTKTTVNEGNIIGKPVNISGDIKPVYIVNKINLGETTNLTEAHRLITLHLPNNATIYGTVVSNQTIVTCSHYIKEPRLIPTNYSGFSIPDGTVIEYEHANRKGKFVWNKCNYYPSKSQDYGFIYVGSIITFPSVTRFISGSHPLPDKVIVGNEEKNVYALRFPYSSIVYGPRSFTNGDCGRPICDPYGSLLGIHCGRVGGDVDGSQSVGARITKEEYDEYLAKCKLCEVKVTSNENLLGKAFLPEGMVIEEGLHPSSDFAWVPITIGVLGHVRGVATPKMTCRATGLWKYFNSKLSETYSSPNPKHAKYFDGAWRSLYVDNVLAGELDGCCDDRIMSKAMDFMTFTPKQGKDLGFVSLHTAITGNIMNSYIAPRNDEKGIGIYLRSLGLTNKSAVEQLPGEEYRVHPKLLETINVKLKLLEEGKRYYGVSEGVVKDECIKTSKVNMGKGRLFFVSCLSDNLIGKMAWSNVLTAILSNPLLHDCYASINVTSSSEWYGLYNHLTDFGRRKLVLEVDHVKMDVHHSMIFFWYKLYMRRQGEYIGYSDEEIRVGQGLFDSLDNKIKIILNTLFVYVSSLGSGRFDTVVANSIISKLLFTYIFVKYYIDNEIPLPTIAEFRHKLRMAFVGDDTLVSVSEDMTWFTGEYVKKVMRELGYEVTPAEKGEKIISFKDISEVTFLKRKFRRDGDFMMAPLAEESIYKSLCYATKSSVSDEVRSVQVLEVAQYEMFMHGKERFLSFSVELEQVSDINFKRFTYEELYQKYTDRDFKFWQ